MKGQAAIEYLSTYGFAILVIVIVIAVLMSLFQSVGKPEMCIVKPTGFTCGDIPPRAHLDNGQLLLDFRFSNEQQQTVNILKIVCVKGSSDTPPSNANWEVKNIQVTPGNYAELLNVKCYENDGSPVIATEGQDFSGVVFVKYRYANDFANAERLAVVRISTKVSS